MTISERISGFAALGGKIGEVLEGKIDSPAAERLSGLIETEYQYNGWFTPDNIRHMLRAIAGQLTVPALEKWTSAYGPGASPMKQVAVIMAGNIPLVGFHDFLCVLLSGNVIVMKTSSDDARLMPALAALLAEAEPRFDAQIRIADGKLENIDAIIATGSNNSSRYFEYYFSKYPHIIRKNRHAAAVLTGKETDEELAALGEDIFRYFGLGCRSVSKLFVPRGYDFARFFEAVFSRGESLMASKKYMNNYDYNKAVYLLNKVALLDNNFLLLKEDMGLGSPASVLFYEFYDDADGLKARLKADASHLQCLAGAAPQGIAPVVALGNTQSPGLADYADNIDTMEFLLTSLGRK